MQDIIGVIYPVPSSLIERLFDAKTKVFVKFLPHSSTRLSPGHVVVFYASQGSKRVVGEGVIETVEFLTAEEVIARYRDRLFLDEDGLRSYSSRFPAREASRQMLTLVLKKLKKYSEPIQYDKPMTMTGQYLSAEEYESLVENKER